MAVSDREMIVILTSQRNDLMQQLLDIQGYSFNSSAERRWDRIKRRIDSIDRKLKALKRH